MDQGIQPKSPAMSLADLARRLGIAADDFSAPDSRFLELPGDHRLHFLDWRGDGPPILFLHGGALSAHTWDYVCVGMRDRYRSIALDMRGHGDSSWSADYRIGSLVDDVRALVDHLDWRRFHLVGMSLGGCVAGHYAINAQTRLTSLTFVDVGPTPNFASTARMRDFMSDHERVPGLDALVDAALKVSPQSDPAVVAYRMRHMVRTLADGSLTWKHDRRREHDYAHILAMLDELPAAAPHITCPMLLVRGGRSAIISDAGAAGFAGRFPRGAWTVVPKAGHNVQEDNPRALIAALRDFFERAPPAE